MYVLYTICICIYSMHVYVVVVPWLFVSVTGHAVNYIVVSHSHSLLIYEDVTLKWAAKTDFTAIQCNVATVQ